MSAIARTFRRVCAAAGFAVTRLPRNRFDAMSDVLRRLAREGFAPTAIVDVGANVGQWSTAASAVYPDVPLHLIEAQSECRPALDAFARARGSAELHSAIVTSPGVSHVRVVGAGTTGAHVVRDASGRSDGQSMPSTTIDALLAHRFRETDRVLLKLDVEGHELEVLAGAEAVLPHVEVVVSEVLFYDVEHTGDPTFVDFAARLAACGFVLYDFAALASRPRDGRLRMGDALFVRRGSRLEADNRWA